MKNWLFVAVVFAMPGQAIAQGAKSCLTPPEAEALVTYALPSVIRAMTTRCTPVLPATTALIQSGPVIAARYQVDADKAWPAARVAFDKISGLDFATTVGEPAAKGLIEVLVGAGLSEKVKPTDCPKFDRIVDILQPLPTKNMAMLITTLMAVDTADRQKKPPFKMCSTPVSGE